MIDQGQADPHFLRAFTFLRSAQDETWWHVLCTSGHGQISHSLVEIQKYLFFTWGFPSILNTAEAVPASGPTVGSRSCTLRWRSFYCHARCYFPDLHQQPVLGELRLLLNTVLELGQRFSTKISSKKPATNRATFGGLSEGKQQAEQSEHHIRGEKTFQIESYSRSVKGVLSAALT